MPPEERIATFDQDGSLWVEDPIYSQFIYCLDRVPAVVKAKPTLAKVEPFSAGETKFNYGKDGKLFLTKQPKILLNDNDAGKAENIHLMIGRRPHAAFGNSTGDRQMLEYTGGRRCAADDAGAARRCAARVCLWSGAGACRTPRSAPFPRRFMTRRRRTAGQ